MSWSVSAVGKSANVATNIDKSLASSLGQGEKHDRIIKALNELVAAFTDCVGSEVGVYVESSGHATQAGQYAGYGNATVSIRTINLAE